MFTIYGGKTEFKQWDLGQKVVNPNMCDCEQVVFRMSNGDSDVSRAYEFEGQMVADVPNELLTRSGRMMVNLGQGQNLRMSETTYFDVVKADKPDGYVCTDNRNLKKKYLETTEQTLTDAEKAQVRKNIGAGEGTGGGGVTDYNKLENRPCSLEFTGETLFHETVDLTEDAMLQNNIGLIAGETYTIICNGKLYETLAFEVDMEGTAVGTCVNFDTVVVTDLFTEYQEMVGSAAGISDTRHNGDELFDIQIVHGTAVVKPLHPLLLPRIEVTFAKNDEGEYTADKTLEEVANAVRMGYDVKAVLEEVSGDYYLTLTNRGFADLRFTAITYIGEGVDNIAGACVVWTGRGVNVSFNT